MTSKDFEDAGQKPPTTAAPNADDRDADTSSVRSTQRPTQAKTEKPEDENPEKPEGEKTERKRRGRTPGSKNKAPE